MGLYDTFIVQKCTCPYCKAELKEEPFQSKQFDNLLDTYKKGDKLPTTFKTGTFEMHHVCPHCDLYFQAQGIVQNFRYAGIKRGTETKTYAIRTSDAKWFAAYRKELEDTYAGEHVFIFNKEVFHDEDIEKARNALIKKYPEAVVKKEKWPDIDCLFGKTKQEKKEYHYEGKWIQEHFRIKAELRQIRN